MSSLDVLFGEDAAVLGDRDFQFLLLVNVATPLATGVVAPILDTLVDPLGASVASIGLVLSAVTAPAIVLVPMMGRLMDRYGRKPLIVSGLLLFGMAGIAIPLTTDFRIVLALRLIQGIGFAGLKPVIITGIGDLYSGGEEATAQGLRITAGGAAQSVIPPLAGMLVVFAWQYPFALYGLAIPIAIGVYLFFEETVDPGDTADGSDGDDLTQYVRDVLGLAFDRRMAPILVARGLPGLLFTAFLAYNSILVVRVLGETPGTAGIVVGVASVSFAVSSSQAGRVTALFGSRFGPLLGSNVALGGGVALVFLAPSIPVLLVATVLTGVGLGVPGALYRSLITEFAPPSLRGGLVSFAESWGVLNFTAGPIIVGAIVGALASTIGFATAVRATGVAVGLVGGAVGIAAVVLWHRAVSASEGA